MLADEWTLNLNVTCSASRRGPGRPRGPRTAGVGQRAMSSAVPRAALDGAVPGSPYRPVRSGTVPALADGFNARMETAPDLTAALPAGAAVALSQIGGLPGQLTPAWQRSPKPGTG